MDQIDKSALVATGIYALTVNILALRLYARSNPEASWHMFTVGNALIPTVGLIARRVSGSMWAGWFCLFGPSSNDQKIDNSSAPVITGEQLNRNLNLTKK